MSAQDRAAEAHIGEVLGDIKELERRAGKKNEHARTAQLVSAITPREWELPQVPEDEHGEIPDWWWVQFCVRRREEITRRVSTSYKGGTNNRG